MNRMEKHRLAAECDKLAAACREIESALAEEDIADISEYPKNCP